MGKGKMRCDCRIEEASRSAVFVRLEMESWMQHSLFIVARPILSVLYRTLLYYQVVLF